MAKPYLATWLMLTLVGQVTADMVTVPAIVLSLSLDPAAHAFNYLI